MPITKKTAKALGKRGAKQRDKNRKDLWAWISSGGVRRYNELLMEQYDGENIKKPQKEAMDRTERLFPYVKARKTDITTDGKEIQPVLVQFIKE